MQKRIKPSAINGTTPAPASKSMMQRAVAIALLSKGQTILRNPSFCKDSLAGMEIARRLGATVEVRPDNTVLIDGGFAPKQDRFSCGESGLGMRMFIPIAALSTTELTVEGEPALMVRPMSMIEEPIRALGGSISSSNGFLPAKVKGILKGGSAEIDGSVSSQMLTGLLIALPLATADSKLYVKNLNSKPYIDMTLQILGDFGVEATHSNYEVFEIKGNQQYKATDYTIEGDWSGAAFLAVAGAIGGQVTIELLAKRSTQADKAIMEVLEMVGATINWIDDNTVSISKNELRAFDFDATHCPDLFPPLVALAAHCKGTSHIKGVSRLWFKESNRALVLQKEFGKLGIEITYDDIQMNIVGGTVKGGEIDSANDHRIAMAGAVACIGAEGDVIINDAACIAKSYPDFYEVFESLSV